MATADKRKICFITGTRADYGIMTGLMRRVQQSDEAELQIIATNMHLSPDYGMTVNEITADGFTVNGRVESLLASDSPTGTVKSMGLTQIGLAQEFERLQPDLVVILGDRYEMLAAASAALIFRIPVAHLYGGETSEGAYDDSIRHAITKLSWLHFTSTSHYRDRVIRMGEEPERVFWAGSLGVDNIANEDFMPLSDLEKSLDFTLGDKFIVCTFHPVTTQPGKEEHQTAELLSALQTVVDNGWKVLFTMPNSDTGSKPIARMIREWEAANPTMVKAVDSLGRRRYYSALKNCAAVVGNSSSGLIEAPSFGIATVNIGDRQKGRTRSTSVIDCDCESESITFALNQALNPPARQKMRQTVNPYAKPGTLDLITDKILHAPLDGLKSFHD